MPWRVTHPEPSDPALRRFLESDRARFLYQLGDLEPPFSDFSRFTAAADDAGAIRATLLIYREDERVALLFDGAAAGGAGILRDADLPKRAAVQFPPRLRRALEKRYALESVASFRRMILSGPERGAADPAFRPLRISDLPAIGRLRRRVPEIWFSDAQFSRNPFLGGFEGARLVAVAGTHVLSRKQGLAAIGSIGVDPACRGRGWGRRAVRAILHVAASQAALIGLNVAETNLPARRLYESLGFETAWRFLAGSGVRR